MIPQEEEKFTDDQLKVMKTQDIKYVEMKYRIERKVLSIISDQKCTLNDIIVYCVEGRAFEVRASPNQQSTHQYSHYIC